MERAIFITKVEDLKYITQKYSRLYFGNEFCQRLIPNKKDLSKVLEFSLKEKLDFSLVTPYVTDEGLEKLLSLFELISKEIPNIEVVINDWGVLRTLRREYPKLVPILGRLLTKQSNDPRVIALKSKVSEKLYHHYKRSSCDPPLVENFLVSQGIKRIELDNLLQGIERIPSSLRASLHIPYVYLAVTRLCPSNSCKKRTEPIRAIFPCHKECRRYTFQLLYRDIPQELWLKGNTLFFINEILPPEMEEIGIDRIVYAPQIPI